MDSASGSPIIKRKKRSNSANQFKGENIEEEHHFHQFEQAQSIKTLLDERTPVTPSDMEQRQASQIFRELVQTESQYVEDLQILVEVFIKGIEAGNILPKKDLYAIFSNVHVILPINERFLAELFKIEREALDIVSAQILDKRPQIRSFSTSLRTSSLDHIQQQLTSHLFISVAEIFMKFLSKDFQQYLVYCSGMGELHRRLESLTRSNKEFASFLETQLRNPTCRMLDLHAFLVRPMQRITKYPLLLREFCKCSEKMSKEYLLLKDAAEKCDSVLKLINDRAKTVNDLEKLVSVSSRLYIPTIKDKVTYNFVAVSGRGGLSIHGFDVVDRNRKLLTEGPLYVMNQPELYGNYGFLFNDILILCQTMEPSSNAPPASINEKSNLPSENTHVVRRIIDRNNIIVRADSIVTDASYHILQIAEIGFQLFIIGFDSKLQRGKWIKYLNSPICTLTTKPSPMPLDPRITKRSMSFYSKKSQITPEILDQPKPLVLKLQNSKEVIIPISSPPSPLLSPSPSSQSKSDIRQSSLDNVSSSSIGSSKQKTQSIFSFWKKKTSESEKVNGNSTSSNSRSRIHSRTHAEKRSSASNVNMQSELDEVKHAKRELEKQVHDLTLMLQESNRTIANLQKQLSEQQGANCK